MSKIAELEKKIDALREEVRTLRMNVGVEVAAERPIDMLYIRRIADALVRGDSHPLKEHNRRVRDSRRREKQSGKTSR